MTSMFCHKLNYYNFFFFKWQNIYLGVFPTIHSLRLDLIEVDASGVN